MTKELSNYTKNGDIVQIGPTTPNPVFTGCLMVVVEKKDWGVEGYIQVLGSDGAPGGVAYYRANWDEIEPTGGRAVWMVSENVHPETWPT
jgi:hypothetical protein